LHYLKTPGASVIPDGDEGGPLASGGRHVGAIDIGDVDLVCQLGSPRAIAAFLQRVGRSGHAVNATPKGRLFPQSRDDLVECVALLDCVRRGEMDTLKIPRAPRDVLAQQIVAEVACGEWDEGALFDWLRRAWPYRDLAREELDAVLRMLWAVKEFDGYFANGAFQMLNALRRIDAGQRIGVDDERPASLEHLRYRALAGRDAAGEAHKDHGAGRYHGGRGPAMTLD
jgi:hypothetical protein